MVSVNDIAPILNTVYWIFAIVFILGLIGFLAWYIWHRKQYRYSVKLRILENDRFVYYEDIARVVKEDGASFWYIKKLKEKAIVPPGNATIVRAGGGWIAEGFYDRNAGIIWGRDELSVDEFKKFIKNIDPEQRNKTSGINKTFQPMTSTQRALQSHQVTKAALRMGQNIWQVLWQVLPAFLMIVIFALILIFWKDVAAPVISLQNSNAEISKLNAGIQQQNLRMYQMLTGGKGNGTYIVQVIPEDQQTFGLVNKAEATP